jgi:hypothetical protein
VLKTDFNFIKKDWSNKEAPGAATLEASDAAPNQVFQLRVVCGRYLTTHPL